jgi:carbamoyltransferase
MIILGINYIFHDSSACLIKDGEILHAVEKERLTRQKHTQSFPFNSVQDCLIQTNTAWEEVDNIAVSINPGMSDSNKLAYAAKLGKRAMSESGVRAV